MPLFQWFCAAAVAAATLVSAAPAAAELTRAEGDGFVSRHEVVVDASPKEVWLALISPARWWRSEHTWSGDAANLTLTPQAGGCFCETIPEGDEPGSFTLQGSVEHMRVIQAYPELALRMQGALGPLQSEPVTGILTIAITLVDAGTRIVWEYNVGGPMRFEGPVISKAVDGVMGAQIAALGKLLGLAAPPAAVTGHEAQQSKDNPRPGEAEAETAKPESAKPAPVPEPGPPPLASPASKPSSSVEDAFGDLAADPQG